MQLGLRELRKVNSHCGASRVTTAWICDANFQGTRRARSQKGYSFALHSHHQWWRGWTACVAAVATQLTATQQSLAFVRGHVGKASCSRTAETGFKPPTLWLLDTSLHHLSYCWPNGTSSTERPGPGHAAIVMIKAPNVDSRDTFSFCLSQFRESFLTCMWRHAYAGWMVISQNFAGNNPVIWRSNATPIIEDRESATSLDCPFASIVLPWFVYQCLVCRHCGKFKQETCLLKMENNSLNQNQNTLWTLKGNYLNKTRKSLNNVSAEDASCSG